MGKEIVIQVQEAQRVSFRTNPLFFSFVLRLVSLAHREPWAEASHQPFRPELLVQNRSADTSAQDRVQKCHAQGDAIQDGGSGLCASIDIFISNIFLKIGGIIFYLNSVFFQAVKVTKSKSTDI